MALCIFVKTNNVEVRIYAIVTIIQNGRGFPRPFLLYLKLSDISCARIWLVRSLQTFQFKPDCVKNAALKTGFCTDKLTLPRSREKLRGLPL